MNMHLHALERHAATFRQLSNRTNGDNLYIHIAMVENTFQTVNTPHTNMSAPGRVRNAVKIGTAHSS